MLLWTESTILNIVYSDEKRKLLLPRIKENP